MLDNHLKKLLFVWGLVIMMGCTACQSLEYPDWERTPHQPLTSGPGSGFDVKIKSDPAIEQTEKKGPGESATGHQSAPRQDIKGIYLNKESMRKENIGTYIDLIKDTGLNAVVMDVKDDFG